MYLTEAEISDLRLVLEAAREHVRLNEPGDTNTMAAVLTLEELIEAHENG
jgi:hypothetical protein